MTRWRSHILLSHEKSFFFLAFYFCQAFSRTKRIAFPFTDKNFIWNMTYDFNLLINFISIHTVWANLKKKVQNRMSGRQGEGDERREEIMCREFVSTNASLLSLSVYTYISDARFFQCFFILFFLII